MEEDCARLEADKALDVLLELSNNLAVAPDVKHLVGKADHVLHLLDLLCAQDLKDEVLYRHLEEHGDDPGDYLIVHAEAASLVRGSVASTSPTSASLSRGA